jgi:hypothetical protein
MGLLRKRPVIVATFVGALLAVASVPQAAWAETQSCQVTSNDWGCTTGTLSANPRYHAVYMHVQDSTSDVFSCYVEDVNSLVVVGRLTTTDERGSSHSSKSKVIRGLYGTYRLRCGQQGNYRGWAMGEIVNDDWAVG